MKKTLQVIGILVAILVISCVLVQFLPFGHPHNNPPVVAEPKWDSPRTRELAQRACYDCHSNETVWPWYSNIAPASWLIYSDVFEGRRRLNFSEWGSTNREVDEASRVVLEGEMPPIQYLILHPNANLTSAERRELAQGLAASLR